MFKVHSVNDVYGNNNNECTHNSLKKTRVGVIAGETEMDEDEDKRRGFKSMEADDRQ